MLHAVIMAGGSGTRFWPQSRRNLPKQFLRMAGDETLIQQAKNRCLPTIPNERVWIVTGAKHAVETIRQLPEVAPQRILLEPCGRNTAPCIGLAAIQLLAEDPDAIMLVTPADHIIQPNDLFQSAVEQAAAIVSKDPSKLVLFGIEPDYPSTGFGYIQRGDRIATGSCPTYHVSSFQEKPDLATASKFLASGNYYWNCGIFVWRAQTILDAFDQYAPEIANRLRTLRTHIGSDNWQTALEHEFHEMPAISIDYAVLERSAHQVLVLEAPFKWDDVGSWQAVPRLLSSDENNNTVDGLCCVVNSNGCIIRTNNEHLIATVGLKDVIVVYTPTATLVADKRDENALKTLIAEMERLDLHKYL